MANQLPSLTWEVDLNTVYIHLYPQPSSHEAPLGRHSLLLFSTFLFNTTPIPDLEIIRNFIPYASSDHLHSQLLHPLYVRKYSISLRNKSP